MIHNAPSRIYRGPIRDRLFNNNGTLKIHRGSVADKSAMDSVGKMNVYSVAAIIYRHIAILLLVVKIIKYFKLLQREENPRWIRDGKIKVLNILINPSRARIYWVVFRINILNQELGTKKTIAANKIKPAMKSAMDYSRKPDHCNAIADLSRSRTSKSRDENYLKSLLFPSRIFTLTT